MRPTKTALDASTAEPGDSLTCPRCVSPMLRQRRGPIEIDVCRACKGVWLDHGELDAMTNLSLVEECYARDLSEDGDVDLLPARIGAPAPNARARR